MSYPAAEESPVSKPIFVVGSGRSGTTLLYRLLVGHPDLAWVSRLTSVFPRLPQLSFFSRRPGRKTSRFFRPSYESTGMYRYCRVPLPTRQRPSLTEADVMENSRKRLHRYVRAHVKWMRRSRFVNKNTNNTMRVRYLQRVFPDALIVHIIRNGYAVANSLFNVDFWPNLKLWWLGKTPQQWEKEGHEPLELCALHWKRQVGEILANKDHIPPRQYFECRYEALLDDPAALLRDVLAFCRLDWNNVFQRHMDGIRMKGRNRDKWRSSLDGPAKEGVERAAGDLLAELGYVETA